MESLSIEVSNIGRYSLITTIVHICVLRDRYKGVRKEGVKRGILVEGYR